MISPPTKRRTHSTGLASVRNASAFFRGTPAPRTIGVPAVLSLPALPFYPLAGIVRWGLFRSGRDGQDGN